jgi:hypothetical protein
VITLKASIEAAAAHIPGAWVFLIQAPAQKTSSGMKRMNHRTENMGSDQSVLSVT